MSVQTISIDLPSDILLAINETEQELISRLKVSLAILLYAQEKVTIGKASQIAGLSRLAFESILSDSKIPISNLQIEEVFDDVDKLN
jgi:predicted HTH domain antitoxin